MRDRFRVYLEMGSKKTFASALDWPGWSRSGKDADGALEALLASAARYGRAVGQVPDFRGPVEVSDFEIQERLKGGGATDFGVPSQPARSDGDALGEAELERLVAILRACWSAFDRAAGRADGVELRKGPRGGGRDLAKMTEHVVGAEESYLRQLGARPVARGDESAADGWPAHREAIVQTLRLRARGDEPENATKVKTRWSPRYFVRRAAWHVLDHAWEVEDRAE
ncbi:MAG: hypothetical protein H0W60_07630 [Chloroflexi bacterium]|nr:hypothetical protein [Chloroflexota bacterium]